MPNGNRSFIKLESNSPVPYFPKLILEDQKQSRPQTPARAQDIYSRNMEGGENSGVKETFGRESDEEERLQVMFYSGVPEFVKGWQLDKEIKKLKHQ